jgi:hypothetical protein
LALLLSYRETSRSGSAKGRGRSTTPSRRLKIAVADPVPSPSATIAARVNPGARRRLRTAYCRSLKSPFMGALAGDCYGLDTITGPYV